MNIVKSGTAGPLPLGKQGERGVTQVHFDLNSFVQKYGEGRVQLTVKRPMDSVQYAAPVTRKGDTAIWEIGGEWTERAGTGECELSWYMGDARAKSVTYRTQVLPGMDEGERVPEPYEGYLDAVQKAGMQAEQAAQTAADDAVTNVQNRLQGLVSDAQQAAGNALNERGLAEKAAESAGKAAECASLAADRAEAAVNDYQPDWDQNDSKGKGYIRNRPFWREVTLLLEGEYRLEDDGTGNGRCEIGAGVLPIEAGKTYLVAFDGKEFVCTAYQSSAFGDIVNIGNAGVTTGASGEPFLLWTYPGVSDVLNTRKPGTYQLRLYELSGYKQLDEVYIPDTIARSDDVPPAIVNTASGEVVAVNDSAERPLRGLTLYGKTVQNGTPSPDNPVPLESVGADGTVGVTVAGKNLFNGVFSRGGIENANGADYVSTTEVRTDYIAIKPSTAYVLSTNYPASVIAAGYLFLYDENKAFIRVEVGWSNFNGHIFTSDANAKYVRFRYRNATTEPVPLTGYQTQLEQGSASTAYEPYNAQTLTAQTPNGLPGIPVSSGGNYTDENGQQWICDEVDFGRGKYVQRVERLIVNDNVDTSSTDTNGVIRVYTDSLAGQVTSKTAAVSNILPRSTDSWYYSRYGNSFSINDSGRAFFCYDGFSALSEWNAMLAETPISVLYQLAIPIETDLSAEELAQYAALRTNYPNTTVFNDSGTGIGVSYVADTKTYIDNKFAQLAAAMLNRE